MGYVADTHKSKFIAPFEIVKTAGTWTDSVTANVGKSVRTAADAAFNLIIPIDIMSNASAYKGCKLLSVEVLFKVETTMLDGFSVVELEKVNVSSAGAVTGAAVATTLDAANDLEAERRGIADHRMVLTVTNPEWMDNDAAYYVHLSLDAAAGSVVTLWGAVANFEIRI